MFERGGIKVIMKWKNKSTYNLIGIIIALILIVVFTLQNTQRVSINIFFWTSPPVPIALIIISSIIIGFLFGWLLMKILAKKKPKD